MTWSKPLVNTAENKLSQYLSFCSIFFITSQTFSLYKLFIFSKWFLLFLKLWIISKRVFPNFGWDISESFGIIISSGFWEVKNFSTCFLKFIKVSKIFKYI